jgi:hypothetical protein
MGLLSVISDLALMPVRIAVDVVKLPMNLAEGEHLAPNTADGLKKIEKDLKD